MLIGTNTIILPGAILNEGVAVGASSIVKTELQPWTIYMGINPKTICKRNHNLKNLAQNLFDNIDNRTN